MQPELSVVVPCFNEVFNVDELTRRVLAVFEAGGFSGELILVDDGSSDGTRGAIEALETAHPGLVVGRFHAQNAGIAQAWRTGVGAARGRLVAIIDADLQYQPEDLLRLRRELLEHSVDVVQGWRSTVGRERGTRYYLSRGLNTMLNAAFGMALKDNKSGIVVCAKEVFEDLLTYQGSYYYWQSFIMVAAHAKGYSYKEVETLFENRRQGESFLDKTAYRAVARSFVDLPKAAWEYRIGRRYHDVSEQFLRRHPVMDRSKPRSPAREALWKGYLATFEQTHWMLTRDVERYYDSLR
jgi:phenylacetate-CoA ligase